MQELGQHRVNIQRTRGQQPHMQARQTCAGQLRQPRLGDSFNGGHGMGRVKRRIAHGSHERPRHKLGVQLPTQSECAQVHADVVGVRVGSREVVVQQQARHMRATGLRTVAVDPHHHMRNGHGRLHGFGRSRMHLVVQRLSLRVLDHQQPFCVLRLWRIQKGAPCKTAPEGAVF